MEEYLNLVNDIPYVATGLGILIASYTILFMSLNSRANEDSNRVISTLTSVIRGEISSLKKIDDSENSYDLFTRIYPTLKDMNNECISEFIQLLDNYNSNWIDTN